MSSTETLPKGDNRTPVDWRDYLTPLLEERADEAVAYEAYYAGEHPMQFATSKFREAFGNLFHAFADNWAQIVVDAPVERLQVVGFRVADAVSEQAWAIWQRNHLDRESVIAHTSAGTTGRSFLLVDPTPDSDDGPRITVEHSSQMVVVCDPGDRDDRLAAMKRWVGDDGYGYCTLYLPDVVMRWESAEPLKSQTGQVNGIEWVGRTDAAEVENPLGVVPAIPLENKPGLLGEAHSDLEPAIPLQNAINKLCTDMIVASEYGAFQQRVITGVEVPKDPDTGQPIASEELKASLSRVWAFKPADARVTSLPATDLSNFVTAVEMLVLHLAAQTRTPPHYLLARMVNMSGDALSVAEAGLTSKCKQKILFFSDPWEEAIALALQADGAGDVSSADCESIWAKPERISQGQLVDAAVKKKSLGIPLPVIWLELGYSPEQIAEMEADLESQREAELVAAAEAEAAVAREQLTATPGEATPPGAPEPAPAPTSTPPASPAPPTT